MIVELICSGYMPMILKKSPLKSSEKYCWYRTEGARIGLDTASLRRRCGLHIELNITLALGIPVFIRHESFIFTLCIYSAGLSNSVISLFHVLVIFLFVNCLKTGWSCLNLNDAIWHGLDETTKIYVTKKRVSCDLYETCRDLQIDPWLLLFLLLLLLKWYVKYI